MKTPAICPVCDRPAPIERLSDGWICGYCGYAFTVDDDGHVTDWSTTSKSHPKGIWTADVGTGKRRRTM